ncbi:unnamed protein product [Lathyrus sativus]|nr:unnamed protein product [Lathyrus sativus]
MSGTSKQQQGGGGKSPQCSWSVLPEEEADQIVNSGGGEVALKKGIEADQTVNSGGGEVALKKGIEADQTVNSGGGEVALKKGIEADQTVNAGGGEVALKKGIEADQTVNVGGGEVALKKGIEADQTVNAGGGEVALKKGIEADQTVNALKKGSTSTRKRKMSSLSSGSDVGKRSKLSRSILPEEEADQRGEVALKKGPWTNEEDEILKDHIKKHGEGNWKAVQKKSGLARCGKSCRLRWSNHLRPGVKKGSFTAEEERLIIECHFLKGTKWAHMAKMLPGRTDNEIKNFWYTRSKKRNRDGLPIYPDEIMSKYSLNDSQESADTLPNESNQHDETETFNFDISDLDLKYYKFRPDMMPPLFDSQDYKPISDLVRQCSDSSHNTLYMPSAVVQQRFFSSSRSAAVLDVFDQYGQYPMLSTPCDPILNTNLLHGYDNPITGFNAASNISSSDPIYGSMTFEPPSFQNSQTQQPTWTNMDVPPLPSFEYVDTPVQAPPIESCPPVPNSLDWDRIIDATELPSVKYVDTPVQTPPIESCPPVSDSSDWDRLIDPIDYDHDAIVAAQLNFLRQVRSEIKNTRRYYINRGAFNDQLPAYYTSNKKII